MARFNPLFAAMLQKARERKRRAERAKARQKDQNGPLVKASELEGAQDPRTLHRHFQLQGARDRHKAKHPPAKKGRTEDEPPTPPKTFVFDLPPRRKDDPLPPKMVKPDERRGQNHYQALEATKAKAKAKGKRRKATIAARAWQKAVESGEPVSATTLADAPLNAAEMAAIDVYLGVSRPTGPDLT